MVLIISIETTKTACDTAKDLWVADLVLAAQHAVSCGLFSTPVLDFPLRAERLTHWVITSVCSTLYVRVQSIGTMCPLSILFNVHIRHILQRQSLCRSTLLNQTPNSTPGIKRPTITISKPNPNCKPTCMLNPFATLTLQYVPGEMKIQHLYIQLKTELSLPFPSFVILALTLQYLKNTIQHVHDSFVH